MSEPTMFRYALFVRFFAGTAPNNMRWALRAGDKQIIEGTVSRAKWMKRGLSVQCPVEVAKHLLYEAQEVSVTPVNWLVDLVIDAFEEQELSLPE